VLAETDSDVRPALTLQDVASRIPGLWIADRGHFALGERIVIRGMGARSPFGVRGIHLLYDGIPLTMPDGQSITDMVDPLMVRRIELVRGPASVFWGNASGGAMFISTRADGENLIRATMGSYGRRYAGARGSLSADRRRATGFISHVSQDGYRDHSDGYMVRSGASAEFNLAPSTTLRLLGSGAYQDVRSPGSLTESEWLADASAANPAFVNTRSGKTSLHIQGGAGVEWRGERSQFDLLTYGVARDLENPLPFAYIDVDRLAGGARLTYTYRFERLDVSIGADVARQSDDRMNFANVEGRRGPEATLNQTERVTAAGFATYLRARPTDRILTSIGLRLDNLRYAMDDHIERADPVRGSRTFGALSPSASVAYILQNGLVYASLATSFETPTTTELVNNPQLTPGFNPELSPEQTVSFEVGVRQERAMLELDLSAFVMQVRDRIASFRTEEGGDRDFFRNTAEGVHAGGEMGLRAYLPHDVSLTLGYAGLHAIIREAGETTRLPAVPPHQLSGEVRWSPGRWYLASTVEAASSYFADEANQREIAAFAVVGIGAGYRGWAVGGAAVTPFLRVSNVLDAQYNRSIVVNASFGRYYEPAPGRTFEAGLTLQL
jgi:iron complex outermembrane recepter protein